LVVRAAATLVYPAPATGVELLPERRRPFDVREDDRHGLPRLVRPRRLAGQAGSAVDAETGAVRVLFAAVAANLHHSSVRGRSRQVEKGRDTVPPRDCFGS
jgi:hypothetical protein